MDMIETLAVVGLSGGILLGVVGAIWGFWRMVIIMRDCPELSVDLRERQSLTFSSAGTRLLWFEGPNLAITGRWKLRLTTAEGEPVKIWPILFRYSYAGRRRRLLISRCRVPGPGDYLLSCDHPPHSSRGKFQIHFSPDVRPALYGCILGSFGAVGLAGVSVFMLIFLYGTPVA